MRREALTLIFGCDLSTRAIRANAHIHLSLRWPFSWATGWLPSLFFNFFQIFLFFCYSHESCDGTTYGFDIDGGSFKNNYFSKKLRLQLIQTMICATLLMYEWIMDAERKIHNRSAVSFQFLKLDYIKSLRVKERYKCLLWKLQGSCCFFVLWANQNKCVCWFPWR